MANYWNTPDPALDPFSPQTQTGLQQAFKYGVGPYAIRDGLAQPMLDYAADPRSTRIGAAIAGLSGNVLAAPSNMLDAVAGWGRHWFEPQGGPGMGADGVSSASPGLGPDPGIVPVREAPTPMLLGNIGPQGELPQVPQYARPNTDGMLDMFSSLAPQAPDLSLLENPPQRQAVVRPDTSATEAEIARLQENPPEAPKERSMADSLALILGGLAAGAARGDGSLRSILANAGGPLATMAYTENRRKAAEDKEYKRELNSHNSLIARMQQDLANLGTEIEQANQDIEFGNEQTRYEALLRKEELTQDFQERERAFQLQGMQFAQQLQEAEAAAINRQLDAEFDRDILQFKLDQENRPKISVENGNYVIQRVDKDGNVTVETRPAGTGGGGLKQMMELGKNDNLPPEFRRKVNAQAAFTAAAQMGDPALMLDVVADDFFTNPGAMEDFEEKMEQAQEQASAIYLPGTTEHTNEVRRIMTAEIAAGLADPAELAKAAKISPLAKTLQQLLYGN